MRLFDLGPSLVHPAPRTAADKHRRHTGGTGWDDVVVHPVADIGDLIGRHPRHFDHLVKESRIRLGHTPSGGTSDVVRGQAKAGQRGFRLDGLIAPPVLRISSPIRTQYVKKDVIDVEISNFDEACFRVEVRDENGATLATHYSDGFALPYRFRLNTLEPGAHTLTFVASDGQREASTSLSFELR